MPEAITGKYLLDRIIKVRFIYANTDNVYEENLKRWNESLGKYDLLSDKGYEQGSETYKWLKKEYDEFQKNKKEPTEEPDYYDIVVDASTGGPKPDITMDVSILPGGLFMGCTVTINNYNCPWDIHSYKRMEVTAGYVVLNDRGERQEITRVFGIDIFYSYCKSPAPDSETVFKGIIVDKLIASTDSFFNTKMHFRLEIYDNTTLKGLINACMTLVNKSMEQIGNKFRLSVIIDKSLSDITNFLDASIKERYRYLQFSSVFDVVQYIAARVSKAAKTIKLNDGTALSVQCVYRGGDIYIFPVNGAYSKSEVVYKLTSISSATLNAGIMTVNAPWYPPIAPGDLIEVSREYIDGSEFPNFLADSEVVSENNLYRVLTMDVQFSSTRNVNSMKIMALPQKFVSSESANLMANKKEFQERYDILYEEGKETVYRFTGILGTITPDNELLKYAKQSEDTIKSAIKYSNGKAGRNHNKADLVDIARGNFSSFGNLVCPDSLKTSSAIIKDGTKFREYGPEYLWPIIYIATFYSFEGYGVAPNDYGKLFANNGISVLNHTLEKQDSYWLPAISSWEDIKSIAQMFEYVITLFDNGLDVPIGDKGDYRNIRLYLENM